MFMTRALCSKSLSTYLWYANVMYTTIYAILSFLRICIHVYFYVILCLPFEYTLFIQLYIFLSFYMQFLFFAFALVTQLQMYFHLFIPFICLQTVYYHISFCNLSFPYFYSVFNMVYEC